MNWWKKLKGETRLNEGLKRHTTFKIGGPCKYFIAPKDAADLKLLLKLLKSYKIPFSVLGSGSNILACDHILQRAIIRLSLPYFTKIKFKATSVKVGAGIKLARLVSLAKEKGLSGCEFLAGIPGTVGGAIIMNAGTGHPKKNLSDLVVNVLVMDYNGKVSLLKKSDIKFAYRSSNLKKYIVLSACLKLEKKKKSEIGKRIKEYLGYRVSRQDYKTPSAGCVFKNPKGDSAGRLIELCGLKGKRIGGARISPRHANFIINTKNARAEEVLRLMGLAKKAVEKKFKLKLIPEIEIWL